MRGVWVFLGAVALATPALAQQPATGAGTGATFQISGYAVEGKLLLKSEDFTRIVSPYVGRGKTAGDMERARLALQDTYDHLGHCTVRVTLAHPEPRDGMVTFRLAEAPASEARDCLPTIVLDEPAKRGQAPAGSETAGAVTAFSYTDQREAAPPALKPRATAQASAPRSEPAAPPAPTVASAAPARQPDTPPALAQVTASPAAPQRAAATESAPAAPGVATAAYVEGGGTKGLTLLSEGPAQQPTPPAEAQKAAVPTPAVGTTQVEPAPPVQEKPKPSVAAPRTSVAATEPAQPASAPTQAEARPIEVKPKPAAVAAAVEPGRATPVSPPAEAVQKPAVPAPAPVIAQAEPLKPAPVAAAPAEVRAARPEPAAPTAEAKSPFVGVVAETPAPQPAVVAQAEPVKPAPVAPKPAAAPAETPAAAPVVVAQAEPVKPAPAAPKPAAASVETPAAPPVVIAQAESAKPAPATPKSAAAPVETPAAPPAVVAQAEAAKPAPAKPAPAAPVPELVVPASPKFEIGRYTVEGNTLLKQDRVDRALKPYTGPGKDFGDVQKALEALQLTYQDAGYGGVEVRLPEQELEKGEVRLRVVEPKIGKITVEGNEHFNTANIRRSVPSLREGETPNSRQIGKEVRLANESPAKQSAVLLRASEREDQLDATIRVADVDPKRYSVSIDNTGNKESHPLRLGLAYQNSNLWNRDHVMTAQFITAPQNPNDVLVFGLGYHIPLYSQGDSVDIVAGHSNVDSGTVQNLFVVSGAGTVFALRYNQNLPRWGELEHKISYGLDYRAYQNDVVPVGGSTKLVPDITVHPFSATYSGLWRAEGKGEVSYYLSMLQNIPGGSDGQDEDFKQVGVRFPDGTAGYRLFRTGASYSRPIAADWQARVRFDGQYTEDALVSGEMFAIGGADSVRGFDERYVSNDKGYRTSWEIYTPDMAKLVDLDGRLRFLVFYDQGMVRRNKVQPGELHQQSLDSGGVGLRFGFKTNMSLRVDVAYVFHDGTSTNGKDGQTKGHFSLAWVW